ncbi:MAG TPA: isoprenylcysteine carboxylmethyltransferase family protein [Pyrinomonadaceae bacterium]|nr:isoprenylcysteine carboxylmethyltransferase family protein [Pyrinomonadaceae bacterium]
MTFLDYFQIASVVIFLLVILTRAVYMNASRGINPIVIGGGKKGLARIIELLSFGGLVLWMIELVLYAVHSDFHILPAPFNQVLIDSEPAKIIGVGLIVIGLLFFIGAFVSFGDSWRVGFDVKTPGKLVTDGIFAVSRNPIYVFLDLWFIGIFLVNGRLVFLIFAILTLIAIHWQILQEEAFLSNLYREPYQQYRSRTGRYVIW